ncbi:MAG: RuvX/YqgF family protein [bacterium JZ-2024 1]
MEPGGGEARRARGRILAVDPGRKRWGFALSDPMQCIVSRYWTQELSPEDVGPALARWVHENEVILVVFGIPVRADRSEGAVARLARATARSLAKSGVAIAFYDESLTTRLAESVLSEMMRTEGHRRKRASLPSRRRRRLDGVSAALLLEYYLAHLQKSGEARGSGP